MSLLDVLGGHIPAICARYGLPEPAAVTPLSGGSANFNVVARFAEPGPPPVKITFCLYKDLPAARRVARLLDALANAPIGRLIGGADDVRAVDGRPVLVTRFLEGEALGAVDRFTALEIGRFMTRLHRDAPPEAPEHDMHPRRLQRLAEGAEGPLDAAFGDFLRDALSLGSAYETLPMALIHGDLFPDNIIRGPDGALGAIDFEEACRAPRAFDLAMTAVGLCPGGELDPARVTGLIAGYTFRRPLSGPEVRHFPGLVAYAAAAVAAWRRLSTPSEMAEHARDWREMRGVIESVRAWNQNRLWHAMLGPAFEQ